MDDDLPAPPPKKRSRATVSVVEPATPPAAIGYAGGAPPATRATSAGAPIGAEGDGTGPGDLTGKTVYIIDANALIFQVFHAIPTMTSPQGEAVNAVYGFTRDILFLLETKKPDYLFAAFDMKGPTFRHELYGDYKVHRAEMPDELVPQLPKIRQMLTAFGVPVLELESFEADDILATVARITSESGGECRLVTSDKDCRQLIEDRVCVYNVRKDQVYDATALAADWHVRPEQVVDFQALVGDSVDHVPGIPGIGPKAAAEVLEKFGTLDAALERADEISAAKRRQLLKDHREQALLSRELVRLDRQVPIAIDWSAGRAGQLHAPEILSHFTSWGFHSFAERVRSLSDEERGSTWEADYHTVATPEALAQLVAEMSRQKLVSVDTETTSVRPTEADIVGYSFAWEPGEAYYVPVCAPHGEPCLDGNETLEALRPIFENPAIGKLGQNLKYDLLVLRAAGVCLRGLTFDTMVASYLLESGERNHNLDELAERYLAHRTIRIEELIGSGKQQKRMDEVPVSLITDYAAEDADVPLRLQPILAGKLVEQDLEPIFRELEMPLIEVLAEMEFNGIRIDTARLAELSRQYGERLATLEGAIYQLAGHEFNIASPKQLQQVLFTEQGLPTLKRTKTGPSTDADVLEELARQHELPAKIIEYRQYSKLKNTYVDALPAMVNPRTGRVHASFNQVVAATGRLSSSDPNLQNIPIRNESGREIRSAFLPGHDDWLLLAADYSQIELRVLAHFSRDETLCAAFQRDEDIHTLVAGQVHNVPQESVTPEMRRQAKAVNFGVIYGQSAFGLAKQIDVSPEEAAAFIDAYFARYPGVDEFLTNLLEECRGKGYVRTIMGRRRAISGVRPQPGRQRNLPERTAINTVIQGSAADLIKQAMITVHRHLAAEGFSAKLLLQIHDELVFEVPSRELEPLARLVERDMSSVLALDVPLKVDLKSGRNWSEVEAWA
ncbi:MAG: DNA polymerase I [Pirellulales bacterium]|nr:DNA polymerase I [Pirellulales bacterium]